MRSAIREQLACRTGPSSASLTNNASARRNVTAGSLVFAVVGAATVARVQGLVLDGATPYNLGLLRPEIAMVTLSAIGIFFELRRRRRGERQQLAVQTLKTSPAR